MSDFEKYGKNRKHVYGSYQSSRDWSSRILKENNHIGREDLIKDISQLFFKQHNFNKRDATSKAKEIILGQNDIPSNISKRPPIVKSRNRDNLIKKLVQQAIDNGYLENFRIAEPWHPQIFFSGEFVSYPFQHNTAIVYRGFDKEHFRKPLEEGKLRRSDEQNAVWTYPFLLENHEMSSSHYAGDKGIILEIQVPTKWIKIEGGSSNIEEIHEKYGSPEKFREHMLDVTNREVKSKLVGRHNPLKQASFLVKTDLPLYYVTGVYDRELFDSPKFLPLKSEDERDYIDILNNYNYNFSSSPSMGSSYKNGTIKRQPATEANFSQEVRNEVKKIDTFIDNYWGDGHGYYYEILRTYNSLSKNLKHIETGLEEKNRKKGLIGKIKHRIGDNSNRTSIKSWIEEYNHNLNKISKLSGNFRNVNSSKPETLTLSSYRGLNEVVVKLLRDPNFEKINISINPMDDLNMRDLEDAKSNLVYKESAERDIDNLISRSQTLKDEDAEKIEYLLHKFPLINFEEK